MEREAGGVSQEAFNQLVNGFQDAAFAYAYGLLRDHADAEDATQAAFLTAWLRMGSLREAAAFGGWLRQIVRTECHRLARKHSPPTLSIERAPDPAVGDAGVDAETKDVSDAVTQAVATLRENDRVVISLHYVSAYSYREISHFLDVPVSTVKKRLYAARKRLRTICVSLGLTVDDVGESVGAQRPSRDKSFGRRIMTIIDLLSKVSEGDAAGVAKILDEQPELLNSLGPWRPGEDNWTCNALTMAAALGKMNIAKLLVDRGTDLGAPSRSGVAPAVVAAIEGHLDVAEFLVKSGAAVDIFCVTALGDLETVDRLLNEEPNLVRERSGDGKTPLHFARTVAVAKRLLETGAEIDATDPTGQTALDWIAQTGRYKELRDFLLERGARAEVSDIFLACTYGDLEAVRRFLQANPALVNAPRPHGPGAFAGATPLLEAAKRGETAIVELLIQNGAEVNAAVGFRGTTALHAAAAMGHKDTVETLVDAGADVTAKDDESGATPAMWAEVFRQEETAAMLRAGESR